MEMLEEHFLIFSFFLLPPFFFCKEEEFNTILVQTILLKLLWEVFSRSFSETMRNQRNPYKRFAAFKLAVVYLKLSISLPLAKMRTNMESRKVIVCQKYSLKIFKRPK